MSPFASSRLLTKNSRFPRTGVGQKSSVAELTGAGSLSGLPHPSSVRSRHGLSFGAHYDPERTSFGALVALYEHKTFDEIADDFFPMPTIPFGYWPPAPEGKALPDPRVGLKGGLHDAGTASWNLRLLSATDARERLAEVVGIGERAPSGVGCQRRQGVLRGRQSGELPCDPAAGKQRLSASAGLARIAASIRSRSAITRRTLASRHSRLRRASPSRSIS